MKTMVFLVLGTFLFGIQGFFPASELICTIGSLLWPLCFVYAACNFESTKKSFILYPFLYVGLALKLFFSLGHALPDVIVTCIGSAFTSILLFLVFFIYGILYRKIKRPAVTILFPVLYTICNLIFIKILHLGNLFNPAVCIINLKVIAQIVFLIGEAGVSFIFFFMTAVAVYIYDNKELKNRIILSGICAALLIFEIVFGVVRLSNKTLKSDSIKVANAMALEATLFDPLGKYTSEEHIQSFIKAMDEAVENKADLMITSEEYASIHENEFDECMKQISELIKAHHIPTVFCVAEIFNENGKEKYDNKAYFFNEDGEIICEYKKYNRIFLIETLNVNKGDKEPAEVSVKIKNKFRKVALAICFDLNDEFHINKISRDVDLIIAPSWDWKDVCYTQPRQTLFRAIERNCVLIKTTFTGIIYAADEYGCINNSDISIDKCNHVFYMDVKLK